MLRLGIAALGATQLLWIAGCSREGLDLTFGRLADAARTAFGVEAERPAPPAEGPRAKRPHLVTVAQVKLDRLRLTTVHTGSLRARRTVRIFNQEEGRIVALPRFEGDAVAEGETVVEIDSALLRSQLAKAVAIRKEGQITVKRLQRLRSSNVVPEDELLRAETALEVANAEEAMLRTRLGYTEVKAPFSGIVTERLAEPGDIAPRHSHLLTIIDPSTMVTDLEVSELLLPHLVVGGAVQVRIDALGDREFAGRIAHIYPELNPRTRQGRVEVELTPVPEQAQAGQFARVTFSVDASGRKVIPFAALRRDRDGEFVFRLDRDSRAHRTAVRSGHRLADRVEVLEGLAGGEQVVVRGFLGLNDGMTVEPVGEAG